MMTPAEQHNVLSLFASKMHEVLEANMFKSGWDDDAPGQLMKRVREELIEVDEEMLMYGTPHFSLDALERECVDVANMIMMVADRTRRMVDEARELGKQRQQDMFFRSTSGQ